MGSTPLQIVIRAVDYCPPIDVSFGEFLRAIITADRDFVPSDGYDYRGALIQAFRRRGITVTNVQDLSEDSISWGGPSRALPPIAALAFSALRLDHDGATAMSRNEMQRWLQAIETYLCENESRFKEFGLCPVNGPYGLIVLESINVTLRADNNGKHVKRLVIEISQTRAGKIRNFVGGATLILGEGGDIRYVIRKRVDNLVQRQKRAKFEDANYGGGPLEFKAIHRARPVI